MTGIGTRKVFENENIAVWELFLGPGEHIDTHTHKHDYVFYVFEGAPLEIYDANGNTIDTVKLASGDVRSFHVKGNQLIPSNGGTPIPATHSARNVGHTNYREVLFEYKR